MKLSTLLPLSLVSALALASLSHMSSSAEASATPTRAVVSAAEDFVIDAGHSSVFFGVKHLNTSMFYGRFNELSGKLTLDEGDPSKSSVVMTIPAASVDTNSEKRDQHVTSPDFLDAKQFANIEFKSEKVSREGGVWKAEGKLTLHGVTKPLSIEFEKIGEGKGFRGEKLVGFQTKFVVDRTEFGMDYSTEALGKDIELTVSIEAGLAE
jgi:polyisoprenoid-binding protein YceI